jgi:hypothetical protein
MLLWRAEFYFTQAELGVVCLQVEPLVRERDVFLSLTMKSSMAVNGCQRVVAVVGKVSVLSLFRINNLVGAGAFLL